MDVLDALESVPGVGGVYRFGEGFVGRLGNLANNSLDFLNDFLSGKTLYIILAVVGGIVILQVIK